MPVVFDALHIPIQLTQKLDAKAEPTHASGLTRRQREICREFNITPEQFLRTKATGEFGRFRF